MVPATSPGRRTDGRSPVGRIQERLGCLASLGRFEQTLCAAVVLGLLARIVIVLCSTGSNDMLSWSGFADEIARQGLWETYRSTELFNHPPLMGWMAQYLKGFSDATGVPFRVVFKLPMFAADVLCLGILWSLWSPPELTQPARSSSRTALLAMAVFACNPVSILVTAFHGNTDSLCAVLGLAAAALHFRGKWWLAGLTLAGAVNVKLTGLLWAPALFFLCPTKSCAAKFVGGFSLGMLPFLGPLLACPEAFHRNAIAYDSLVDLWGIHVLSIKLWDSVPELAQRTYAYRLWGKYLIIASVILVAAWARYKRLSVFQSASISMALFLLLTPGFGVQYLVWLVPMLAATSLVRSLAFGLSGGLFIGWIYESYLTEEFPLRSHHNSFVKDPIWVVGVFAWLVVAATVFTLLRSSRSSGDCASVHQRS